MIDERPQIIWREDVGLWQASLVNNIYTWSLGVFEKKEDAEKAVSFAIWKMRGDDNSIN